MIGTKDRSNYDKQVAIFSQVTGAIRDEGDVRDNTLIFYQKKNHWAWFIPLDKDVVSIGVVTPSEYFTSRKLSKDEFLRQEMQTLNPELARRVQDVQFTEETRGISNYSYWIKKFVGNGFLCVGDSHRFIDPIFSLGLLFATKESEFAATAIHDYLGGRSKDPDNPFAEYEYYADQGKTSFRPCWIVSGNGLYLSRNTPTKPTEGKSSTCLPGESMGLRYIKRKPC